MKYNLFVNFFCILLSSIILASCNLVEQESDFPKLIVVQNVNDINQSLNLRLDPYKPSDIRMGNIIHLEILNEAKKSVRLSADRNVQLFLLESGSENWVEVKNNVEYQGKGEIITPQGEKGLHEALVSVKPDIGKYDSNKVIRVVVTGIIVENGEDTENAVSAYLDLTLKP